MKRSHAAFEALAGAILLGEAGDAEKAEYAAHARACPLCECDIERTAAVVGAAFAQAKSDETWRPFVRDEVVTTIDRRRTSNFRLVATALGAGVVGTLGLNLALGLGFSPAHAPLAASAVASRAPVSAPVAVAAPAAVALASVAERPRVADPPPSLNVGPTLERSAGPFQPAAGTTFVALPFAVEGAPKSAR